MARRCEFSGKGVMSGNKVSHAVNKTRRRFIPNLQSVRLVSETLGKTVHVKLCTKTIRTVDIKGGLDGYLLGTKNAKLAPTARVLKKELLLKMKAQQQA